MLKAKIRPLVALLASAATAVFAATASAQTPGLPMWVIKDADSTIYMTGTVHMLPQGLKWDSEKLTQAMKDSTELWLELPMGSDPMKTAMAMAPTLMKYALSTGKPLSSLLTPEEKAALDAKIKKSDLPPETSMVVNMMKPWYATLLVGISPLMAAGFDPEAGIDVKIAKMAETEGDAIKGFESFEDQIKILSAGTEEQQLEGLRQALKQTDAEVEAATKRGEVAFTAWANGDLDTLAAYFADAVNTAELGDSKTIDALLKNRNENWAGQIETMLKGSGTHFIAVGAGHLVGPDSVQERLKLRGISTSRY